jgi:hypothetical protein
LDLVTHWQKGRRGEKKARKRKLESLENIQRKLWKDHGYKEELFLLF